MNRSTILFLIIIFSLVCPNTNFHTPYYKNSKDNANSSGNVSTVKNETISPIPSIQTRVAQFDDNPPFYQFSPDPIAEEFRPIVPILDFYSLKTGLNPLTLLNGTGTNVTIALLSSGIAGEVVSDLFVADATCTLDPANVSDVNPWNDTVGHGTALASMLVGGEWGSRNGLVPDARLLNVKVFTGQTRGIWPFIDEIKGDYKSVAAGIEWVVSNHPETDIILVGMPVFGGIDDSVSLAVTKATNKGILVIAPVGNHGSRFGTIMSPACSPLALSVGAAEVKVDVVASNVWTFNPSDIWNVASFSSRGPSSTWSTGPDLIAPGVNYGVRIPIIKNKTVETETRQISGTGVAATYVAGGVAAMLSTLYRQGTTRVRDPLGIKISLKNTAEWLSLSDASVTIQGEGLVQFYKAWQLLNTSQQEVEGETIFDLKGIYPRHAPSEPYLPFLTDISSDLLGPASDFQPSAATIAFCTQKIRIPFLYYQGLGSSSDQLVSLNTPSTGQSFFTNYLSPSYQEGYTTPTSFQQLQILIVEYEFAFSPKPYLLNKTWQFMVDGNTHSYLPWSYLVIPSRGQVGLDYSHDGDGFWEQDSFEGRYFGWRKRLARDGIIAQPVYNLSDISVLAASDLIVLPDPEIPLSLQEYDILTNMSQTNHSILLLFDHNDSLMEPFRALSKETQHYLPAQYYHSLVNGKGIRLLEYTRETDDERTYPGLGGVPVGPLNYTISYVTTASNWYHIPFDPLQGTVVIPMRGYYVEMFQQRNDSESLLRRDPQYGFEEFSRVTYWSSNSPTGLFVVCGTDAPFSVVQEDNPLDPLAFYHSNSSSLVMAFTHFLLTPRFPSIQVTPHSFPAILFQELIIELSLGPNATLSPASSMLSGRTLVHYGHLNESTIWYGPATIENNQMTIPLPEFYSGPITLIIHIQGDYVGQHWFVYTIILTDSPFTVHVLLTSMIIGFIGSLGIIGFWYYRRTHVSSPHLCPYCLCHTFSSVRCDYCCRKLTEELITPNLSKNDEENKLIH